MKWEVNDPVLQFTLLIAAALVVLYLFERLRVPGLIGLMLLGMGIGPDGAGFVPREPVVAFLGDIGLIYVMFMAGLEFDLGVVRGHKQETAVVGVLTFILPFAPAIAVAMMLGWGWAGALLLAALISSHTLVAYPEVQRMGLGARRPVVAVVGGTLITDTAALLLLAIVMQVGTGEGSFLSSLTPLALLFLLVAAAIFIIPRISRPVLQREVPRWEKALYTLVVLMTLASITELIGTERILGAFLAGVCLNQTLGEREVLREHVEFLGQLLFVPFFFMSTGMLLKFDAFGGDGRVWMLAGILLALVVSGKAAAAWIAGWRFGYPLRERLLMIGLTLPQAAATLAVTVTARRAGFFDEEVVDAVILLIFVTCLAGPLLTRRAARYVVNAEQPAPPPNPSPID